MGDAKSNTDATRFTVIQTKQVIGFFCIFVLVYCLLMFPWPGLRAAYSKLYRTGAAFLFKSFGSKGVIVFEKLNAGEFDTKIVFYSRDQVGSDGKMVPVAFIQHNSRRSGYIYVAFLSALILATPISWRRKGWALLWGMILIHIFIIFNLAVWLLYGFNKEPLSLIVLGPFCQRVLLGAIDVFIRNLTFGLVVCVFIWILVSFRREDWSRILARKKCLS